MTEPVNPCEDCSKSSCGVCEPITVSNWEEAFDWSVRIYQVSEDGRKSFDFLLLNKEQEVIASGSAKGIFTVTDLALEAIVSNGLAPNVGESPSLTDLAFQTGVLVERNRVQKYFDEEIDRLKKERAELIASNPDRILELTREELDSLLMGDPTTFEERLKDLGK